MRIEVTISTDTLGDYNTLEDNLAFAGAVKSALSSEYPQAEIAVELRADVSQGSVWVSEDPIGDIEQNVRAISNRVWDKGE